jgi:hypothetical protein
LLAVTSELFQKVRRRYDADKMIVSGNHRQRLNVPTQHQVGSVL